MAECTCWQSFWIKAPAKLMWCHTLYDITPRGVFFGEHHANGHGNMVSETTVQQTWPGRGHRHEHGEINLSATSCLNDSQQMNTNSCDSHQPLFKCPYSYEAAMTSSEQSDDYNTGSLEVSGYRPTWFSFFWSLSIQMKYLSITKH